MNGHKILHNKEIPISVSEKIHQVYPFSNINIKRKVEGGKARIVILFIDNIKVLNSWRSIDNLMSIVESREITENHIVSDFMCNEYYKHLSIAHDIRKAVLSSDSCDQEYIENIWWLLKFQKLMDMSITGFNQSDLTHVEIQKIIDYLNTSDILYELSITHLSFTL